MRIDRIITYRKAQKRERGGRIVYRKITARIQSIYVTDMYRHSI